MSLFTINTAFSSPVSAAVWVINDTDQGMMTNDKMQSIINNAQPGDTIQFAGLQYTHIHLSINKPLNIISTVSTQLYACPSNIPDGSDDLAIFSIHDGAVGTNISGFKITNQNSGYGIYVNNTSSINISNNSITCTGGNGIKVTDSSKTNIINNNITNSNQNGILLGVNVYNTLINNNNITSNKYSGINLLESCNNVTITDNSIALNYDSNGAGRGVYVNSTINGLNISENFIYRNGKMGLCYDLGVTSITENTQIVENNYLNGHTGRDVIYFVHNSEGNLDTAQVWIGETCFGGLNNVCPKVQVSGEAVMSEIQQLSPGKYNISIVDKSSGLLFEEFGSFYVTFFLNKNDTNKGSADPGDVWKEVLVQNGIATVDFTQNTYKSTNNTIFVIAPYIAFNNAMKDVLTVKDSEIPSKNLNLSVNYTIANKVIKTGETITYHLKVNNNNTEDATGVLIKNILSTSYYTSKATAPRGSYSNGVWNLGTLKAGETLTLIVNATAKKSGTTRSQAQITGTNVNTLYSKNISKTIHKYVKLSYVNSVSSKKVKKGHYVYLTSKITNSGLDVSDPVGIKMTLPIGMKMIYVSPSGYYNKNTKSWTYNCSGGKTTTFTMKAQVTSKGTKKITFNTNGKTETKNITGY